MFGYKPKHAEPEPYRMTAKEATTDELIWFLRTKRPDGESIIHEIMAYTIETLGLEAMLSDTIMDLRIYDDYVAAQNLGGIRR